MDTGHLAGTQDSLVAEITQGLLLGFDFWHKYGQHWDFAGRELTLRADRARAKNETLPVEDLLAAATVDHEDPTKREADAAADRAQKEKTGRLTWSTGERPATIPKGRPRGGQTRESVRGRCVEKAGSQLKDSEAMKKELLKLKRGEETPFRVAGSEDWDERLAEGTAARVGPQKTASVGRVEEPRTVRLQRLRYARWRKPRNG